MLSSDSLVEAVYESVTVSGYFWEALAMMVLFLLALAG